VCHDVKSNLFFIDLRLSARTRTKAQAFVMYDSIIHERDSTTVTIPASQSFGEKALQVLEFVGVAAIGVLFGLLAHL
jgi:hypothetical protein